MTEIRQNLFWTGARKLYRSRLAAAGLDLHWGLLVLPLLFDTKTQHLISNDLVFWRLVSCHNITIPWAMEVKLIGHGSAASIFWATPASSKISRFTMGDGETPPANCEVFGPVAYPPIESHGYLAHHRAHCARKTDW